MLLLLGFVFSAALAAAQNTSPKPAFEVASVKPASGSRISPGGMRSTGMVPAISGDPRQINYPEASLAGLLARAYDVKAAQIVGPDWLSIERYAISAKVPDGAPAGQIPAMLQTLLEQRFGVKVHWESKQAQGFALVAAKLPPNLVKTAVSDSETPRKSFSFRSSGQLQCRACTLNDFADTLGLMLQAPVENRTDIEGLFDISLNAAPDSMPGMKSASADSPHPSIFTAINGLGLKLNAGKVSLKQLIVDSAEKVPTDN